MRIGGWIVILGAIVLCALGVSGVHVYNNWGNTYCWVVDNWTAITSIYFLYCVTGFIIWGLSSIDKTYEDWEFGIVDVLFAVPNVIVIVFCLFLLCIYGTAAGIYRTFLLYKKHAHPHAVKGYRWIDKNFEIKF